MRLFHDLGTECFTAVDLLENPPSTPFTFSPKVGKTKMMRQIKKGYPKGISFSISSKQKSRKQIMDALYLSLEVASTPLLVP